GEAVDLVGIGFDIDLAPREVNVGMGALLFRHDADAVHEGESRFEIGKQIGLDNMMLVDDLTIGDLGGELPQLLTFEGRHAAAAGDAVFFGEFAHSRSTQMSPSSIRTG